MIKARLIIFVVLLSLFFNQNVHAYGDDASLDDTCTESTGILNRIVADLTTLGLFSAYSDSFHMDGADGYGSEDGCNADRYPSPAIQGGGERSDGVLHNSTDCGCGSTTCSCPQSDGTYLPNCDPKGGVYICYDQDYVFYGTAGCDNIEGCTSVPVCEWAQDDYGPIWYWAPPGTIRVAKFGDKLCAQFDTTLGYQSIGCKYLPQCEVFDLEEDCFVAKSCSDASEQKSRSILPITGVIIQCVSESVDNLFVDNTACTTDESYTITSFPQFQGTMRNAVRSCLMLYLILWGLKTVLGADIPDKKEFFVFGAKFVLVMYFSTGININMNNNQAAEYSDGITTYMRPLFVNGSADLANIVYSAGGSEGLCVYDEADYEPGYGYLSLWDSIDCRILYYLGIDMSKFDDNIELKDFEPILLSLILPAIFSFQLIFMIFTIVFFIFFLSVIIYFVNITVISIILLGILIYLAPVFVPMVLFEVTKGYYDSWLKLTASYALQPMVIAAYIAMMLTIFDQTMFGDCTFKESESTITLGGVTREDIPVYKICAINESGCSTAVEVCAPDDDTCTTDENVTKCEDTIGYIINPTESDTTYTNDIGAIFFTITILKSNVASDMLNGLITLCLFGYLFYKFAEMLSEFAGELTGGPGIGSAAGDPMALVKAAGNAAMTAGKAAMQGKGDSKATSSEEGGKDRSNATSKSEEGGKDSSNETSQSEDKGGDESGAKSAEEPKK